ncbi:hypothetical protein STUTZSP0542_06340 [Stutzerimonas marianensis]
MSPSFRYPDIESHALIAREMNNSGYSCIANFLTSEQLSSLREVVQTEATNRGGEYFAHHGGEVINRSLLGVLGASPVFRELLSGLYRQGTGRTAYSDKIYQVLRCVQGGSGRRESNCFHYDASLVTVLLPIEIPQQGTHRGDLIVFPNVRGVRSSVLFNVLEKTLLQNRLTRSWITAAIRRGWLKPKKLQLVPGNLYLFWGYRSLHANEPCDPAARRATAIFHYGDPHAGSLATRLILKLNQRRARRATAASAQRAA